ncbi:MAG: molybdopterin-guanine dinucleotide biosynthesis protein B [Pseudomonadota bacterium]
MPSSSPDLFGITGWKNSGKTTLVVKLVEEFIARGVVVSTVKHAHDGFDIDHEGTDSYRHRYAGAHETAIVSNNQFALMHQRQTGGAAPSLERIITKLAPCDLVLVEGFKTHPLPKIECLRKDSAKEQAIWHSNKHVVALATDHTIADCPLPQFELSDVGTIADYIGQKIGLHTLR